MSKLSQSQGPPGEQTINGPLIIKLSREQANNGLPWIKFVSEGSGAYDQGAWFLAPNGNSSDPANQLLVYYVGDSFGKVGGAEPSEHLVRLFGGLSIEEFATPENGIVGSFRQVLTDGPTVTPVLKGQFWTLDAAGSRTVANPTVSQFSTAAIIPFLVTLRIKNTTVGAITTTFGSAYHLNWTDPAAGKYRTTLLMWDGVPSTGAFWQIGTVSGDLT